MRGSLKQCLEHLFQALPDDDVVELLAEFTQVRVSTVRSWREGLLRPRGDAEQLPRGEGEIRLRVFLEAVGYDLDELRALHPPARQVSRLLAYGVEDFKEVQSALDYTHMNGLFRLLRGGAPTVARAYRFERIAQGHAEELAAAQQRYEGRFAAIRLRLGWNDVAPDTVSEAGASLQPVSLATVAARGLSTSVRRRRERARRGDIPLVSGSEADPRVARVAMHLILALDDVVGDDGARTQLAAMVHERVSPKRLRALRDFLNEVLTS